MRIAAALGLLLLLVPASEAGSRLRSLQVEGRQRTFLVHVPDKLDRKKPAAVVLVFHGAGSNYRDMVQGTRFNQVADEEGFLVVYPQAAGRGNTFDAGGSRPGQADDLAFVRALLRWLKSAFAIDERRIYATGFSNGAMLCYRLAAEMSESFAAIAPVAGGLGKRIRARPRTPVSLLHVHGTGDRRVPVSGSGSFHGVNESLAIWSRANRCQGAPQVQEVPNVAPLRVRHRVYSCPDGVAVEAYLVLGGRHTWPRGPNLWLTRAMWRFFRDHPRVTPASGR